MGSNGGSNSDLQECGLQQWWSPSPIPEHMYTTQELPSVQITVTFHANLTDLEYNNVRMALRTSGIDNDNVTRDVNVIRVTGYDQAVLEGPQVLSILQKYDRQARRMSSAGG